MEGSDSACDATVVRGSVFDGDRSCMCLPDDVRPGLGSGINPCLGIAIWFRVQGARD